MRKIIREMLAAIREEREWRSGNTSVHVDPVVGGVEIEVWLHGNLIAKRYLRAGWEVTFAGWLTATTASRLHAIVSAFGDDQGIGRRDGEARLIHGLRTDSRRSESFGAREWRAIGVQS